MATKQNPRADGVWKPTKNANTGTTRDCTFEAKPLLPLRGLRKAGINGQPNGQITGDLVNHQNLTLTSYHCRQPSISLSMKRSKPAYRPAYNRFIFDFVLPNNSTDRDGLIDGFLEFLPNFYKQSSPDLCLFAAVSAVSFANFDERFESPEARLLGSEYCGKALKLIQYAIQDYSQAKSDETLFAVYLLGIYEVSFPLSRSTHAMLKRLLQQRFEITSLLRILPQQYIMDLG